MEEDSSKIMAAENGCNGNCCQDFILSYSPAYMETLKENGNDDERHTAGMVIYLGYYDTDPDLFPEDHKRYEGNDAHHYTCKHFDTKTRLCTDYENRPNMCRSYPNGIACTFKGCGYNQVKEEIQNFISTKSIEERISELKEKINVY